MKTKTLSIKVQILNEIIEFILGYTFLNSHFFSREDFLQIVEVNNSDAAQEVI